MYDMQPKIKNSQKKEIGKAVADENVRPVHYWIYAPGDQAIFWDEFYKKGIMGLGWDEVGDYNQYKSKKEIRQKLKEEKGQQYYYTNSVHAIWQFANEMQEGDVIFAKKGTYTLIGRGVVKSEYYYDETRKTYKSLRKVEWTHKGEWEYPRGKAPIKTLTDMTPFKEFVKLLKGLFEDNLTEEELDKQIEKTYPIYTKKDFLKDVFLDEQQYNILATLLKNKKNLILQGAPGVGKTYIAKRLAYSIMGEKNTERVMMVQFHQSYSYEDFIMGFKPSKNGFELTTGPFYEFCKKADEDDENDYFFIIDEINRGNLSKIFGELFMLIENDKRGIELQMLYANENFSIPPNLYIIGMMNTADRSLALLDYALRRRFAFFELEPAFSSNGFLEYRKKQNNEKFDNLISVVEKLNKEIENDDTLGKGFKIGHSYFMMNDDKIIDDDWLNAVLDYEIIPLINEYWFDEPRKVADWSQNLRNVVK